MLSISLESLSIAACIGSGSVSHQKGNVLTACFRFLKLGVPVMKTNLQLYSKNFSLKQLCTTFTSFITTLEYEA